MKVTFKNVDSGDTVIITWDDNGVKKIGIVDCKLVDGINPAIEFLSENPVEEIEFIFLSHPHYDHYSGILSLFNFCEETGKRINTYAHTYTVSPNYLELISTDKNEKLELSKIIKEAKRLKVAGIIKNSGAISNVFPPQKLGKNIELVILSPGDDENQEYIRRVDYFKGVNQYKASQAANLLSTMILIYNTDSFLLLSADSEKFTYSRLNSFSISKKLIVGQIPHHGSINNHDIDFWKKLYSEKSKAAISAGKLHNHPSYIVVKELNENGFSVDCTGYVNGYKAFSDDLLETDLGKIYALDTISEETVILGENHDLVYEIPDL